MPEETFRLRWHELLDGAVHIAYGKAITHAASSTERTCLGATRNAAVVRELRVGVPVANGERTCREVRAKVQPSTLYTFRHRRLTLWAADMDPYTLAYLAAHSDSG